MKDVPLLVAVVLALILVGTKWHAEHLRLETGSVSLDSQDAPPLSLGAGGAGMAKVASTLLDDGRLLVVAGPLSFSDVPRHLVLVLEPTSTGWVAGNVGVRWTLELPESSQWVEPLYGSVRIDSTSTAEEEPFRCAVDLWCERVLEGRFALACSFQHVPGFGSESATPWITLLESAPLPSR